MCAKKRNLPVRLRQIRFRIAAITALYKHISNDYANKINNLDYRAEEKIEENCSAMRHCRVPRKAPKCLFLPAKTISKTTTIAAMRRHRVLHSRKKETAQSMESVQERQPTQSRRVRVLRSQTTTVTAQSMELAQMQTN